MDNLVMVLVGLLLLVLGYFIGIRQKINLVHSYHYKRVAEANKPAFCKGVGIGTALVGVGLILFPLVSMAWGEKIASWSAGAFVLVGLAIAIATILRWNKGLF